ncbi:MAG TPA: AtpZ/AtpI family protein [Cyclobacteriaceae bacterium]|nr:AtpZ/AtpI family protein [Cyclobacteriaceae bacterium]
MKRDGNKSPKEEFNSYLKYSGLGLQLLLTILVAGWVGYKIDGYLSLKFPAFMLLLGLTAFAGSLYQVYRNIRKD